MSDIAQPNEGEIIFYSSPSGQTKVEVLFEAETSWLNQKRLAELFGVDFRTISYHLKEIYSSGELTEEATLQKIRAVQKEGGREVAREIEY